MSLILLGTLILAINFAPVPNSGTLIISFINYRSSSRNLIYKAPTPCEKSTV